MWTRLLFRPVGTREQYFLVLLGLTLSFYILTMVGHLHIIMTKTLSKTLNSLLLVVSWVGGFLHSVMQLSTNYGLLFCGPKVTDHFMCNMNTYWNSYVLTPILLVSWYWPMEDLSALLYFCSYWSPMESSCTLWKTWVRREAESPSHLWFPTSLWLSASLFLYFYI